MERILCFDRLNELFVRGDFVVKYSIIEKTTRDDFLRERVMYGIRYFDGEIERSFEDLVDDRLKITILLEILNAEDASLETARQYVENLLFEAYCKYL